TANERGRRASASYNAILLRLEDVRAKYGGRRQHHGIGRHHLGDRAPLHLIEGEADGHSSIVQAAGGGENVPQGSHRSGPGCSPRSQPRPLDGDGRRYRLLNLFRGLRTALQPPRALAIASAVMAILAAVTRHGQLTICPAQACWPGTTREG